MTSRLGRVLQGATVIRTDDGQSVHWLGYAIIKLVKK